MKLKAILVAALAAALSASALPASAEARPRPACSSKGSKTVLASKDARIFTKKARVPGSPEVTERRFYGCLYRTKRKFVLGHDKCFEGGCVENPRLAGPYAGFSLGTCRSPGCFSSVRVKDLRTGRLKHDVGGFRGTTGALELTANGSVARVRRGAAEAGFSPPDQVRRADAAGEDVLLDSGSDIDSGSLALSQDERTVFWTKGGTPRSAPID